MKFTHKILILALLFGAIASIANSFNNEYVLIFFRQLVIPCLLLYYFKSIAKISVFPIIILSLCWLMDLINFTSLKNFQYILILGICSYMFLLLELVKNLSKIKITFINLLSLFIVVFSIGSLYFYVMDFAAKEFGNYDYLLYIYAFVLALIIIFSSYNLNYRNSNDDLNFFYCASTFFISDIFYLMNEFYEKYQIVVILNFFIQLLSYFFIIRYYIYKEKNKDINQTTILLP